MSHHSAILIAAFATACLCTVAGASDGLEFSFVSTTLWSSMNDLCIVGSYGYCAMNHGLMVVDLADPIRPRILSLTYIDLGTALSIAVSGNYAYLACGKGDLQIFDISNPADPARVSQFQNGDYNHTTEWVSVSDGYAYVTNGHGALDIVDVSDPLEPTVVSRIAGSFFYDIMQAVRYGDYLCIVSPGALTIFDITDPAAPDSVVAFQATQRIRRLSIAGTTAYLAGDSGLCVVDLTDPTAPQLIGALTGDIKTACDIEVIGNFVYVALGSPWSTYGGLWIVDITYPFYPTEAARLMNYTPYLFARANNLLYMAESGEQVISVDITNPPTPVRVGILPIPKSGSYGYHDVAVNGKGAYVACGAGGAYAVDITDPAEPVPGTVSLVDARVYSLALRGPYLYVAANGGGSDPDGLYIFDISDPDVPMRLSWYSYHYPNAITIAGNYAFLGGDWGLSYILDISNPYSPTKAGSFQIGGITFGIAVAGNYAYYANWQSGIKVVDISNITAPVVVDSVIPPSEYGPGWQEVFDAVIYKGYLVIAARDGLRVYDINTNPAHPAELSHCSIPGESYALFPYGDYIFVAADYYGGVVAVDMTVPLAPTIAGSQTISGSVEGIAVYNRHVYAVDDAGMMIFACDVPNCCLTPGDADLDGLVSLGDVVLVINYIFKDGPPPGCPESADANHNCLVDIADPVYLMNYFLREGPPPICGDCK
jgi:hypothetical protein